MNIFIKILAVFSTIFSICCYAMDPVLVDLSNKIDTHEGMYHQNRELAVKTATKHFIGLDAPDDIKLPRINMCCSGGGVRAETASIGFLAGAEQINFLKTVRNIASLSGSTWAVIPWILHRMSPVEYAQILKKQLQINFWSLKDPHTTSAMVEKIKTRVMGQHRVLKKCKLGITEIWGQLVARRLLYDIEGHSSRLFTFGDIREILNQTNVYPFPIFTTLIAETHPNYEGFEVTPFSAYSSCLKASVKTQFFGSVFTNGTCQQILPEKPLCFYMGVFGSAFTISPADALINLFQGLCDAFNIEDIFLKEIQPKIQACLEKIKAYNPREFDVKLPNIAYGLPSQKMGQNESLHLLDYGIHINLPIFPFTRPERQSDILVICDASSDASDNDFTELKKAKFFASMHNMPFPTLNRFKEIDKNLKIFYEDNPEIPFIIYVANNSHIFTLDMNYDEKQFDSVYQPMVEAFIKPANKQALIEAVRFKTSQLNGNSIPNNFKMLPDGKIKSSYCSIL